MRNHTFTALLSMFTLGLAIVATERIHSTLISSFIVFVLAIALSGWCIYANKDYV